MTIILAPDKFKGSLTGIEFCDAVEEGIKLVDPNANVIKLPLADGGDGTIDIISYHLKGKKIEIEVHDPLFRKINAAYLFIETSKIAFIEMAKASGMDILKPEEQNCYYTTTLGTGELILDAIDKGAQQIILGIGGSATNDCGMGMAAALGYQFLNRQGQVISPIGQNLSEVKTIDDSNVSKNLSHVSFRVACDVTNPLYGKKGAAFIYGAQKGSSNKEIELLDQGMMNFSKLLQHQFNIDVQNIPGAGAAGGMGAGALTFLNAKLVSGIDLVKDLVNFDQKFLDANWVITGEGKLDAQTLSGKTIKGVLETAKQHDIPVAAFCGSIDLTPTQLKIIGVTYADAIINHAKNIDVAINNAHAYLRKMATKFTYQIRE